MSRFARSQLIGSSSYASEPIAGWQPYLDLMASFVNDAEVPS